MQNKFSFLQYSINISYLLFLFPSSNPNLLMFGMSSSVSVFRPNFALESPIVTANLAFSFCLAIVMSSYIPSTFSSSDVVVGASRCIILEVILYFDYSLF